MDEIRSRIRPVLDRDRGRLLSVSYSKLDLLEQCSRKYKLQYVDKKFCFNPSLATEFGSIAHKVLELKGRDKIEGKETNYQYLKEVLENGIEEKTEKGKEYLLGTKELSTKYLEEWYSPDNKSGMTYPEKVELFLKEVLPNEMENKTWKVLGCEIPFEFVYKYGEDEDGSPKEVICKGFIDRVDYKQQNLDNTYHEFSICDYKTSKACFDSSKIKTSLQMVMYDLACLHLYGEIPIWHEYSFIAINDKQTTGDGVCSKGYLKRGIKKLDRLLNKIDELAEENIYAPSPSPLCAWCAYSEKSHTPHASDKFSGACPYHSLWTYENRTFAVAKEFDPNNPYEECTEKRKIIF